MTWEKTPEERITDLDKHLSKLVEREADGVFLDFGLAVRSVFMKERDRQTAPSPGAGNADGRGLTGGPPRLPVE